MDFVYIVYFSTDFNKKSPKNGGLYEQAKIFSGFLPALYSNFAEKGEKNGMKFVKMHKNHFQNEKQVV